jgi:hypothetical protein
MGTNIQLIKEVYGINTYTKTVDTNFTELITPSQPTTVNVVTVDDFFQYYEQLFFEIPVSGPINSHEYLVNRSQEYLGGSVVDAEKQALIEEINSLRQQLLDLNVNFSALNNIG